MKNKLLLFLISSLISYSFYSQERVKNKEVYIDDNDLIYKVSNDQKFTGFVEKRRKNGHLVYEEEFKEGVIVSFNLYYNGKEKKINTRVLYNENKPFKIKKEFIYSFKGSLKKIISYDENGIKNLEEHFEEDKLTYSCEYKGKKRHGIEFCYNDEGEKIIVEYINGKRKANH